MSRSPLPENRVPIAVAQPGEVLAVAQQEVGGAVRAGREHQAVAGDRVPRQPAGLLLDVVHDEVDLVAALGPGPDRLHLVQGAQVGAVVLGRGQVVVVEAVLGAVVAADVALAAQPAGRTRRAVQVAVRGLGQRQAQPRLGAPRRGAKLTASGGSCQSSPSSAAASCIACVFGVAANAGWSRGYGVAPSIFSTAS